MEVWVWLLIAAAVVILFGWQTVVDRRKRKAALREHLERMWGGIPERKYTKEELERIASYSNLKEKTNRKQRLTILPGMTWKWTGYLNGSITRNLLRAKNISTGCFGIRF